MSKGMRAAWWWIDRWQKSTAYKDLTLAEQGAYRNLLDELWLRDGVLPNDERILARLCGDPLAWSEVRPAVMAHFTLSPEGWRNETHDAVSSESERRAEKQKRYRDRQRDGNVTGNVDGNAGGNGCRNVTSSPSPSPSLSKDQSPEPKNNTPHTPRKRGSSRNGIPEHIVAEFETFWLQVPVRIGKAAALQVYAEKRAKGVTAERILEGVAKFAVYEQQKRARDGAGYKPLHPRTWLSQARWEDEIQTAAPSGAAAAPAYGPRWRDPTREVKGFEARAREAENG